jgi:hypothetical protein
MNRTYSLVGVGVGLVAFLVLGLLPSMLYGGYAGILLASGIYGTPIQATFMVRAFIIVGMVFGVTAIASLFAVVGAVVGAAIGALTRLNPLGRTANDQSIL